MCMSLLNKQNKKTTVKLVGSTDISMPFGRGVIGDCDINDFTAYCEDLDKGEFIIAFSEKVRAGAWRYILDIYIKLDEESYETYNELT